MRFKGLDLNLLVALNALLEELSVSRAAERMHVSQPAMSASLGRLRGYFGDALLMIDGKRMIPTPLALRLKPHIGELLGDVERMIATSGEFHPARSVRHFRIGASDYIILVVFADLMQRLAETAPGLSFEFFPPSESITQMLNQGQLDLLIVPEDHMLRDQPWELLLDEAHVVAGWSGNPLFERGMTAADFDAAGHIAVQIGVQFRASFAEANLTRVGRQRRVEVVISSFAALPDLLVNTGRLALMHERMAKRAASHLPIAYAPTPFDFPHMREVMQYHRTRADDPGLSWLRRELTAHILAER